jgi:hypothetical protein
LGERYPNVDKYRRIICQEHFVGQTQLMVILKESLKEKIPIGKIWGMDYTGMKNRGKSIYVTYIKMVHGLIQHHQNGTDSSIPNLGGPKLV